MIITARNAGTDLWRNDMSRKLKFATTEEQNCGECRHFFHLFAKKVFLGKYEANGWCWIGKEEPFYTANNMVCNDFKPFFKGKE